MDKQAKTFTNNAFDPFPIHPLNLHINMLICTQTLLPAKNEQA